MPESSLTAAVHPVEHHRAHAASAFFVSPFDEAAVLTLDGFGDFASTMLAAGRGNRLEVLGRVLFPHSLGIFYTALTQWLGFPHYGDEGKVMGLAPYGDPERYLPRCGRSSAATDGSFRLGLEYFTHHTKGVEMTWDDGSPTVGRIFSARLEDELGPARAPARGARRRATSTSPPRSRRGSRSSCSSWSSVARGDAPARRTSASRAASR